MAKPLRKVGALTLAALLLVSRAGAFSLPESGLAVDAHFVSSYSDSLGVLTKVLNSFTVFTTGDFTAGQHISGTLAVGGTATLPHNIGPYTGVKDGLGGHYFGGPLHISDSAPFTATAEQPRFLYVNPAVNVTKSYEKGVWTYTAKGKTMRWTAEPNITLGLTDSYIDFNAADDALQAASTELAHRSVAHITVDELKSGNLPDGIFYGPCESGQFKGFPALTIPAGHAVILEVGVMEYLTKQWATLNFTGDVYTTGTVVTIKDSTATIPTPYYNGDFFPMANHWYGESMGLIWNLPEAVKVTTTTLFGHLLAPNAYVSIGTNGGNMDGSVVAASARNAAECHAWGFHASLPAPGGPARTERVPLSVSFGVPLSVPLELSLSVTFGVPLALSFGVPLAVPLELPLAVSL